MLTTPQLSAFFPDLLDERFESALLLVHSRFSTNTFPSWPLAHPYRYVAHNGEINTVQGNQNWMRAREAMVDGTVVPGIDKAFPICTPGASDTARFDEVLELLHLGGRPIHHAMLMMIPEAWENNDEMDPALRAFYRFHSTVMEPWDGPASVTFTDGTVIGAVLDRNGLRPEPLLGHRRRPRGHGVGGRRHRHRPGQGRDEGPPAARPHVPHRHRPGAHRRRRGDQGDARRRAPLRRLARAGPRRARRPARARARRVQPRQRAAPPAAVRLHPRGAQGHPRPDRLERRGADRLDGHRHADRRAVDAPAPAVRLLLAALRPGHQPAARRHPRGGRDVGVVDDRPGGEPAPPRPGQLPPARAAVPGDRQRRALQDRPRQRRRALPRAPLARGQGPLPRRRWRPRPRARPVGDLLGGVDGDRGGRAHHRPVGPQRRRRRGTDPVAAADRRRAPPPRAHEAAHDGRAPRRVRRRPRGAPHGAPHRVRRRRHQPVPGVRVDRGPHRRGAPRHGRDGSPEGRAQLHQGVRQGRPEGDVEDGRLDGGQLHRRPDLRGHRAQRGPRRAVLHRHGQPPRRHRAGGDRDGGRGPPRPGPPDAARGARPPQARARRRVPVAPRGRDPPLQPGDGVQAAARHAVEALRHLPPVLPAHRRPVDRASPRCAACSPSRRAPASRCRSTRSSRCARSCAASRPGR